MSTERTNEIEATASEWLIRRDGDRWSESDQLQLTHWLEATPLNRVAFLRLERAWEEAARLKALGAGIARDEPPPPGHWNFGPFFSSRQGDSQIKALDFEHLPQSDTVPIAATEIPSRHHHGARTVRRGRYLIAGAAFLAIAFSVALYTGLTSPGERYVTPVGGIESVPIADGSKVTLNTNTQVLVALSNNQRRVEIKQGEAFFEVAHDPERPFVVTAGHERVIAVGTQFSVRREGDDIRVIVTEGRVRVEDSALSAHQQTVSRPPQAGRVTANSGEIVLTPGSVARASGTGVLVRHASVVEAEEQISWRTGVLMFREQTLADAVAEFNRYNVRQVVIADPVLGGLKIEGNFRATNVEAFVRLLESAFPVRVVAQPDRIVLTTR